MGVAGLWAINRKTTGEEVMSFTMLTINADSHPVFNQFHRPEDEKRMVVILREDQYDEWLDAPPARSMAAMQPYPAQLLMATPEPERGRREALQSHRHHRASSASTSRGRARSTGPLAGRAATRWRWT